MSLQAIRSGMSFSCPVCGDFGPVARDCAPSPLCLTIACAGWLQDNTLLTPPCVHCRLTGHAVFSTHLTAKQGRLVDVPRSMTSDTTTVKQLADYLEPILTAAAGGSLNAYCS